jgi:endonuclease/exonuclease/phosphatase family metal-dependent hydrolase
MHRSLAPFVVLAMFASGVACTSTTSTGASSDVAVPVTLRVATFNIEYGGEVIDFDQVTEAALALDADVLAIQEPWGHIPRLAHDMGYRYYDARRYIISRLPLLDPPGSPAEYTFVEIAPGRVVAFGTVHLTSSPYGPVLARRGAPADKVLAVEEDTRVPEIAPVSKALAEVAAGGTPTFLAGDFNTPSHLDWTAATVGARPHLEYPLAWPVTLLLERAGFRDSFREIHPDPLAVPGLTWPSDRPKSPHSWNPKPTSPADRIDFVFAAGPSTTIDSRVLTEDRVTPWPSDHRAVVSTFQLRPAAAPMLVSPAQRLWYEGDDVSVHVVADADSAQVEVRPDHGGEPVATDAVASNTTVTFDTSGWAPGAYEVALQDGSGVDQASSTFWVAAAGEKPRLTTERSIAKGEPIVVSWSAAPGNRFDWIGIYRRGADPNVAYYLLWVYTGATIEGSATLDETSEGRFPLPAGKYTAMLLVDDSYEAVAATDFTITKGAPG